MAPDTISYPVIFFFLIIPLVLVSPRDLDGKTDNQDLEGTFLARFLAAKRQQKAIDVGENEADMVVINLDNSKVERRLLDCEKRREIIVMDADSKDKSGVCYIHAMDDAFYQIVCLGRGQMVNQFYNLKEEILDKGFLSKDEQEGVCKSRQVYYVTPVTDKKYEPSAERLRKGKWFANWNYIDWPKT